MAAIVILIRTTAMICTFDHGTQEGHLFDEGASGPEAITSWVQDTFRDDASLSASRGTQENGNSKEPVVIKFSVPYTADFGFGQIKLA